MTALSPRFAGASIALLVATAVPVLFHWVIAPTHDDCANPEAFFGAAQIGGVETTGLKEGIRRFEGAEGWRRGGSQYYLAVRVVRTFSPSQLVVSPIRFGFDSVIYLHPWEGRTLAAGDDFLPVHWGSYEARHATRIEAYSFVQGGVPVWHPLRSGFAMALPQLVGGTRPVTVLVASGATTRDRVPVLSRAVERWLADAWRQFEAACGR